MLPLKHKGTTSSLVKLVFYVGKKSANEKMVVGSLLQVKSFYIF